MLRPARMLHFNALVMDSDVDAATTQMLRSRLVHLVSVTDLEPWANQTGLQTVQEEDIRELTLLENTARSIAEKLGLSPEGVSEGLAFQPFDPDDATKKLEEISREINPVVAGRDAAAKKLASLKETRLQTAHDFRSKFGIDVSARYTLLEVALGRLPERNEALLKRLLSEVPNVVLTFPDEKGKVAVMAIVLKTDRAILQRATEEAGFERLPAGERKAPLPDDVMGELDERIQRAQEELGKAQAAVEESKAAHLATLRAILSQTSLAKLTSLAKTRFRKTARTYLISGWTPRHSHQKVVEGLKKACENRCVIEEHTAEELLSERGEKVDVPILFQNPRILKPFEMLVSSYGRPAYNSIDPTVVVAPTFLLMFGVMFGDVGQGLVLGILGVLVARSKRVSEGIRRIGELFTWCGCSAVLFGFLYGSVFGFGSVSGSKRILPYNGFEFVESVQNVGTFLTLALFFGVVMISLGLVFNVVAAIRKKDWATGLLDRTGLMGLAFYWLAVAAVVQLFTVERVSPALLGMLILLPVVATFLKAPVKKLVNRRRPIFEGGILGYVLRSVGGILGTYCESILTFLSNTVSFLRLAAFAIAHGALFIAVFSLADVVRGGGVGLPILIHILGNAGMIALEGLVVCVQAVRLEYYEFFGKFFHGGGTEFTPMKLPMTVP